MVDSISLSVGNAVSALKYTGASGPSPPGPPPGALSTPAALPLDPTGALKRTPGPHATRLARVARSDFLHFVQALLNQWGTQPSLEQSYATDDHVYNVHLQMSR